MSQQGQGQLSRIVIKGFKSIKECDLELNNINVFIGCNGAGKSNFISVFSFLSAVMGQSLSQYVAKKGGASSLLYNGKKVTDSILAEFYFGSNLLYGFELEWTENDGLYFREERIETFGNDEICGNDIWGNGGYSESKWRESINMGFIGDEVQSFPSESLRIYHVYDTGTTSKIKEAQNISNAYALHDDASNLAALLYRLQSNYPTEYNNILNAVQIAAPYFVDFKLKPEEENKEKIVLRWQKKDCDDIFTASQLSDGTLRFICLATLLLQPSNLQPAVIIIDEPELGLHPFAITLFAEMVKKAAVNRQIILSTQSVELLNNFNVDNVVVVDWNENGSEFKRLDADKLKEWLEDDYTLGDLWNKNILGGRFAR